MSPSRQLLALLLHLGSLTAGAEPPVPERIDQLHVNMTARQARDLVGPPATTARQVFYQGYLEQWIYDRPEPFRLDILYRLGRGPQVQAIHRPHRPRR